MRSFKLANKRERWGLTIYGWLFVFTLFTIAFLVYVKGIVAFLSAEDTIDAKIMVIEGYIPDYAYDEIIKSFNENNYEMIVTSGATFDQGFYLSGINTSAGLIRNSLLELGFDSAKVVAVPVPANVYKDRTYHSAIYSHKYIREHFPDVKSVNIVSLGPHATRSLYLFRMVYEPEIQVGNIVIPHISISTNNWYKSSRGFKGVMDETTSYFYVRFFFWPDKEGCDQTN